MAGINSFDDALHAAQHALQNDTYRIGNPLRTADPVLSLLLAQALLLEKVMTAGQFGSNYIRVTPISLVANTAKRVLVKETQGLVRKVTVAIDNVADGNALPTIRIGTGSGVSTSSGGPQVQPSVPFDFQELAPNSELYMISSSDVSGYIIERA